ASACSPVASVFSASASLTVPPASSEATAASAARSAVVSAIVRSSAPPSFSISSSISSRRFSASTAISSRLAQGSWTGCPYYLRIGVNDVAAAPGDSMGVWFAGFALLALLAYVAITFNELVAKRNQVKAAWADIDVQLQRRHDLVPQLAATVKGYA